LASFTRFDKTFGLFDTVIPIDLHCFRSDFDLTDSSLTGINDTSELLSLMKLGSVQTVPVDHSFQSHAVVLRSMDGEIIAFSGDCRPSAAFAEAGKNASLLIHESTFDDDTKEEAIAKRHTTLSEAIEIGRA
jgi:ribonuclease Z